MFALEKLPIPTPKEVLLDVRQALFNDENLPTHSTTNAPDIREHYTGKGTGSFDLDFVVILFIRVMIVRNFNFRKA